MPRLRSNTFHLSLNGCQMEERGSGGHQMPVKPVGTTLTGRSGPPLAVPTNKHAHADLEEMTREGNHEFRFQRFRPRGVYRKLQLQRMEMVFLTCYTQDE